MCYRCLRCYLLSWHRSRLGFVTPIVGEVSLGPLGSTCEAEYIAASKAANEGVWMKEFISDLGVIPSALVQ